MFRACSRESCETCPERVLCHCYQVTESQLAEAMAEHNLSDLKDVSRHTRAGDACTCCHEKIREFLVSLVCTS